MASRKKVTVTSENFGDLLVQGLTEAVDVADGRTADRALGNPPRAHPSPGN
jgi:hypothetical protein